MVPYWLQEVKGKNLGSTIAYLSTEEINSGFSFSNEAGAKWLLQAETI